MSAVHYGTTACLQSFSQVRKSLPAASLSVSGQIQSAAFEDEFGRFRVWAANIGALQKAHSSLDYRLRDAPLVRDNVQKLLKELHDCLQQINVVMTGTRLPFDRQRRPNTPEYSDKSSSSEDDSSSDNSSVLGEPRMSELEQRFLTVVDIVDNLYKFSRMVRTPAFHTRFLKAASYKKIDRETGVDLIGRFETADYAFVSECFSSFRRENGIENLENNLEDAHLIKRFAAAITKRRQQFLYWKRHRDKLGVHARTEDFKVSIVVASESVIPIEPIAANLQAPIVPVKGELHSQVTINTPVAESSIGQTDLTATTATIFIPVDNASDAGQTTTSFATTARGLDGARIELPSLPKSVITGKDFECHYCFSIVPSRYQTARGWREHVLRDLKPYVCTYPGCALPHQLFGSRSEWLEHEQWEHRKKFTCQEHSCQSFQTAEEFHVHVEESPHKISSELSFDALVDISRTSVPDDRRRCPICLALFDKVDQFHNHISNHLERFAAFALPRDVETIDDGDESKDYSNHSSGHSLANTEASLKPETLSIAEQHSLTKKIIDMIWAVHDSLTAGLTNSYGKMFIPEPLAQLNNVTERFTNTFLDLLKYPEKNLEAKDLRQYWHDAIRCQPRLQNLLDSFRLEDLWNEPQQAVFIATMLDREQRIFSQLVASLRNKFAETQAVLTLYDFVPTEPLELAFKKGDVITVVENVYRDWWKGSLGGVIGIFPLNYVEKLAPATAENLDREAKLEEEVYVNLEDAHTLGTLCNKKIEFSPAEWDKLAGRHRKILAAQPALNELLATYSQRNDSLVRMGQKFTRALVDYENLLELPMGTSYGHETAAYSR